MDVGEFPSAYGRSDSPGYERGGAPYDGELQQAADQLQRENAYLVERVKSFEKGLMSIYQVNTWGGGCLGGEREEREQE